MNSVNLGEWGQGPEIGGYMKLLFLAGGGGTPEEEREAWSDSIGEGFVHMGRERI